MTLLKKTFGLLLTTSLAFTSYAQISITSSNMPKSGDTIRYSEAALTDLPDLTKTGADYEWNYGDLSLQSQAMYEYKASWQTPYILNFGFTAIGQKIADSLGSGQIALQNVYNFYKNSSSKFETVGIGFQYGAFPLPQAGKHSNSDKIYEFPLTYNDKNTDDFEAKVSIVLVAIPVGDLYQKGTRTTEVDGWGKITTPYADEVECIRVKSVIEQVDSVVIASMNINFALPTKRVEYKWLSKTERIPVLEISGTEVLGNFVPTYIRYRDTFRTPKGRFDLTANFEADKISGTTNDTFTLKDMSEGSILQRVWSITPNTFNYVNGTDANSTNPQVTFSQAGQYSIKLGIRNIVNTDSMDKADYIDVQQGVSVQKPKVVSNLVYPNPFINKLEIRLNGQKSNIFVKLYDANGKVIFASTYKDTSTISISTEDYSEGTYFLEVDSDSEILHQKLLKIK